MQPSQKTPTHPARINEQVVQYWESLKGERALPLEEEVNPQALSEVWDSCFLVQVLGGDRFSYSYLGSNLIEAYGDDITGHEIAETLVYPPQALFEQFKKVVQSKVPQLDGNEFRNSKNLLVKYRSCVVPLAGRKQAGVTYLLGGMKWKIY